MTPANNKNQKSPASVKSLPIDDDDKWTDVAAKDATVTDGPIELPPAPKPVQISHPPPPPPNPYGLPPRISPYPPWQEIRVDSPQVALETRLSELAQVELGLVNTIDILERYLIKNAQEVRMGPSEIPVSYVPSTSFATVSSSVWSTNRSQAIQSVTDMGHLIGLKRAIKLLEDALNDPDRHDVKCTLKQVAPPPPPPGPVYPLGVPMGPPPPCPYPHNEREIRRVTKDVVKDMLKEYKDGMGNPGQEDVQKEMIKLIRDISLQALQKG